MDKYQFWYQRASKNFVEVMNSIKAVKTEVTFTSLNGWSPKRRTFEMLKSPLPKIYAQVLWDLLKSVSLLSQKLEQ